MIFIPVVAALKAELEPTPAFNMATALNLFDDAEALPALLAVARQIDLLLRNTLPSAWVDGFTTVVAVLFLASAAKVYGLLILQRLDQLPFRTLLAFLDSNHSVEIAEDSVDSSLVFVLEHMINAKR